MSALLLTLPFGKYFGFDEIWDDATAVEGLRQVGEAGQACYWIHHKVATTAAGTGVAAAEHAGDISVALLVSRCVARRASMLGVP